MAEVLAEFDHVFAADDGTRYRARACAGPMDDGRWQGWIEFLPLDPSDRGEVLRSQRETTQPNRTDAVYWATGLTAVYLEGAFERALSPAVVRPAPPLPAPTAVLDPFSIYQKGEEILRRQLGALSSWHLVNILRAEALTGEDPAVLNQLSAATLIELIVAGVRRRLTLLTGAQPHGSAGRRPSSGWGGEPPPARRPAGSSG